VAHSHQENRRPTSDAPSALGVPALLAFIGDPAQRSDLTAIGVFRREQCLLTNRRAPLWSSRSPGRATSSLFKSGRRLGRSPSQNRTEADPVLECHEHGHIAHDP
jgi:hypothetical protein